MSPGPERRARRAAGFTLLEVIVALAVMAVAIGAVFQAFSTGLGSLSRSEAYLRAALIAESRLALVGGEIALEEGSTSGESEDGYRWSLEIKPHEPSEEGPAGGEGAPNLEAVGWRLYEIAVTVELPSGPSVALKTLKLGVAS